MPKVDSSVKAGRFSGVAYTQDTHSVPSIPGTTHKTVGSFGTQNKCAEGNPRDGDTGGLCFALYPYEFCGDQVLYT